MSHNQNDHYFTSFLAIVTIPDSFKVMVCPICICKTQKRRINGGRNIKFMLSNKSEVIKQ